MPYYSCRSSSSNLQSRHQSSGISSYEPPMSGRSSRQSFQVCHSVLMSDGDCGQSLAVAPVADLVRRGRASQLPAMASLLHPQLHSPLQLHLLPHLDVGSLLSLAQACRATHALVLNAPQEIWPPAVANQMPWHPPVAVGREAACAAVHKQNTCAKNFAGSRCTGAAEWCIELQVEHSHALPEPSSFLSRGGTQLAMTHLEHGLAIKNVQSGKSRLLHCSQDQNVISACWHPDDVHISILSEDASRYREHHFAVYSTHTGPK